MHVSRQEMGKVGGGDQRKKRSEGEAATSIRGAEHSKSKRGAEGRRCVPRTQREHGRQRKKDRRALAGDFKRTRRQGVCVCVCVRVRRVTAGQTKSHLEVRHSGFFPLLPVPL